MVIITTVKRRNMQHRRAHKCNKECLEAYHDFTAPFTNACLLIEKSKSKYVRAESKTQMILLWPRRSLCKSPSANGGRRLRMMLNTTTRVTACKWEVNCSVNCILSSIWRRRNTTADYILLLISMWLRPMWLETVVSNILWLHLKLLFAPALLALVFIKWPI